jgi:predicted DNA-binding transcriptional regulator AlpA
MSEPDITKVEGLTYKPLLKMSEVCQFFQVSRPTIYGWIKHDQLKPFRIRRNVYFLWNDIQRLIECSSNKK